MRALGTVPGLYFTVSPPKAEPSPLRSDVAGFIGRTRRGPIGIPTRVEGWRGYQRVFGGLDSEAVMAYAIRGYFENEGEVAHVIRLSHKSAKQASAKWKIGEVDNEGRWTAASPLVSNIPVTPLSNVSGRWANNTRIKITIARSGCRAGMKWILLSASPEPTQYFTAYPWQVTVRGRRGQPQTFAIHTKARGSLS